MSERTERLARNEGAFRTLNERAREVTQELEFESVIEMPNVVECVCECANADCTARLRVPSADYELARSDPVRFLVARGHEVPDIERPVFEGDGFLIVEKHPGERRIVTEMDTRR